MTTATTKQLITPADRFSLTFCLAIMAHGIIILGTTFSHEDRPNAPHDMNVTLVYEHSEPPEEAQTFAQADLQGSGAEVADKESISTPIDPPFANQETEIATPPAADPQPPAEAVADEQKVAKEKMTPEDTVETIAVESSEAKTSLVENTDKEVSKKEQENQPERQIPQKPPSPPTPSTATLIANISAAALRARIDRKLENFSKRLKVKYIAASTKGHVEAAYRDAWETKVERIGNLNYPEAARKMKLSGSLRLDVALNQNGSINQITVLLSSGHKILDDAAIRIVKLAAPYAPFPDQFREEEVDILHIIRTWRFSNGSQFK